LEDRLRRIDLEIKSVSGHIRSEAFNREIGLGRSEHFVAQSRAHLQAFQEMRQGLEDMGPEAYAPEHEMGLYRQALTRAAAHKETSEPSYYDTLRRLGRDIREREATIAPGVTAYKKVALTAKEKLDTRQRELADLLRDAPRPDASYRAKQYHTRSSELDEQITQLEDAIGKFSYGTPWGDRLEELKEERARLQGMHPNTYNPPYEQKLTSVAQALALRKKAGVGGTAALEREYAELLRKGPRPGAFNRELYAARVRQLDEDIARLATNIRTMRYSSNWGAYLKMLERAQARLRNMDRDAYDPQYEEKVTAAANDIFAQVADLARMEASIETYGTWAKREIAAAAAIRDEIVEHGAARFNPSYFHRVTELSFANVELEKKLGFYSDAQKAETRTRIAENEALLAELRAKGPEGYGKNEAGN
jgi:hypothetical protein